MLIMKECLQEMRKKPSPRQRLKDMIRCEQCDACVVRQEIVSIGLKPEEICQHSFKGVCTLEEAKYGPHTLAEVGELLGFTRERIRQVEEKAIRKMRHKNRSRRRGLMSSGVRLNMRRRIFLLILPYRG